MFVFPPPKKKVTYDLTLLKVKYGEAFPSVVDHLLDTLHARLAISGLFSFVWYLFLRLRCFHYCKKGEKTKRVRLKKRGIEETRKGSWNRKGNTWKEVEEGIKKEEERNKGRRSKREVQILSTHWLIHHDCLCFYVTARQQHEEMFYSAAFKFSDCYCSHFLGDSEIVYIRVTDPLTLMVYTFKKFSFVGVCLLNLLIILHQRNMEFSAVYYCYCSLYLYLAYYVFFITCMFCIYCISFFMGC